MEELKEATSRADEAERKANALESRGRTGEDKIESLEEQLKVCVTERLFPNWKSLLSDFDCDINKYFKMLFDTGCQT